MPENCDQGIFSNGSVKKRIVAVFIVELGGSRDYVNAPSLPLLCKIGVSQRSGAETNSLRWGSLRFRVRVIGLLRV